MRCVIQKVTHAEVVVEGETVGKIGDGFMVLLGAENGDTEADARYCAEKIAGLRVFEDENDKMNLSLADVGGSVLLVSQFTLLADARHGRRPDFIQAARPEVAEPLCDLVKAIIEEKGIHVETGRFRTHMQVTLLNDGPVTILLDSRKSFSDWGGGRMRGSSGRRYNGNSIHHRRSIHDHRQIRRVICGLIQENAYIVQAEGRDDCVVVDPGDDYPRLKAAIGDRRVGADPADPRPLRPHHGGGGDGEGLRRAGVRGRGGRGDAERHHKERLYGHAGPYPGRLAGHRSPALRRCAVESAAWTLPCCPPPAIPGARCACT